MMASGEHERLPKSPYREPMMKAALISGLLYGALALGFGLPLVSRLWEAILTDVPLPQAIDAAVSMSIFWMPFATVFGLAIWRIIDKKLKAEALRDTADSPYLDRLKRSSIYVKFPAALGIGVGILSAALKPTPSFSAFMATFLEEAIPLAYFGLIMGLECNWVARRFVRSSHT